jgi:hypothetical protein
MTSKLLPAHEPDHYKHRRGHPGERVAGLQGAIVLNVTQEPGHKHYGRKVHELKHKDR